jgi:pimeloyl-ACP methyl ester carboxylesterase
MLPILLIPGLNCSATLFANQIPPLWRFGSVVIANHTCGETVGAIAQEILKTAPPRFTLIGFSMGGYIAFEILRQAGERIARLALIDTGARADTAQQSERRLQRIAMAQSGRSARVVGCRQRPKDQIAIIGTEYRGSKLRRAALSGRPSRARELGSAR